MRRAVLAVGALVSAATCAAAEVTVVAGTGQAGRSGDGGPAARAQVDHPFGVVRGPDGALYVCEFGGHAVRRIAADGTISTVAGTGTAGYTGDGGAATNATLHEPHEIRFDRRGDLFIADTGNHAIRKVDRKTGVITTIAGTGRPGYAGDGGPAARAQFKLPISCQFDAAGNLFVCDIGNHVIRRIDASGAIATFAGTGKPGPTPDGAPLAGTPLLGPRSLDVDAAGTVWLATREGNQVLKLDAAANRISVVAGTGKKGPPADGPARLATLNGPKGIAIGPGGAVWLADTENHAIRRIDPASGKIERVAGGGAEEAAADSLRLKLARPHGLFVEPDGTLFVGDSWGHRVLRIRPRRRPVQ